MNTIDIIRDCWNIIRQTNTRFLVDVHLPLIYIEDYLCYFEFPLLSPIEIKINKLSNIFCSIEPSFKGLTDDILVSLRRHIYAQKELSEVKKWAEKLMRFCEVRYGSLKTRAIKKCRTKDYARLHILHLTAFFMDQAICNSDQRFLNIALKLMDLKWLFNRKRIKKDLIKKNNDFISALFQFRIMLTTEYAIIKLCQG